MKSIISCLLIVAAVTFSTPSKALVGLASGDDNLAVAGLAFMDLSQIWVVDSTTTTHYHRGYRGRRGSWHRTTYVTYRLVTFPAFFIAGLVLLDEEGRTEISADLTDEMIAKADLSKDEVEAFKAEIEEINNIKDVVASEISTIDGDEEVKTEAAGQLWTEYASALSKNAAIALAKITNAQ